jgi:hypothetical protein
MKVREPEYTGYDDPHPELSFWDVITIRNSIQEEIRKLQKPN